MGARADIVRRIRALREKTPERGCSEGEAMAAAAKAAELMATHGLNEDDLVIEQASSTLQTKSHTALRRLWAIVALCTNTSGLNMSRSSSDEILFVGLAPGPEIAVYLRDVLARAAGREVSSFKNGTFYRRRRSVSTRKQAVADFLDAFVDRLGHRLFELFAATKNDEARQRAVEHIEANYRSTSVDFKERKTRFDDAAWEGHSAGGRVNLGHGVASGRGTVGQIGSVS